MGLASGVGGVPLHRRLDVMLWSVYWHVQQTKTVEGFPGHVSCCGGRINMCRPDGSCWFGVGGATLGLLIVCGPRLSW